MRAVNFQPAADAEAASGQMALEVSHLEALYRTHAGFVWRNARRLGCDDMQAEDVAHEVFLIVERRLSEFRNEANIRTWLFAITYRVVQRWLRDDARRHRRLREYAADRVQVSASHPEKSSEASQYLRHLLGQLDECQRVVFILSELEGMTSIEIGQMLGTKPRTIESRLRAARKAIARFLQRDAAKGGKGHE